MSDLPQETIDKITIEACKKYPNSAILDEYYNDYQRLKRHVYATSATEWAGKAQPVIDALEELVNLKCIKDQFGKTDEYLINQPLAWEAAINALAKYKEVTNG